jgi:Prp8 binding protein
VQVYDLRTQKEVYALGGHTDTPVSLAVSPNGNFLLAPSLSSTTLVHDIRPFAPAAGGRVHRALTGAPAGFESTLLRGAWSRDDGGRRVAVGGADRTVCVWDVDSGKVLYKVGEVVHTECSGAHGLASSPDTRARSRRWTSTQRSRSVSMFSVTLVHLSERPLSVLTGSKDATLLLGELEPAPRL